MEDDIKSEESFSIVSEDEDFGLNNVEDFHVRSSLRLPTFVNCNRGMNSIEKSSNSFAFLGRKLLRTTIEFNLLAVGRSGVGKTTLLGCLFNPQKDCQPTTQLMTETVVINEYGLRIKYTTVDTPGFGDEINNEKAIDHIIEYIDEQFEKF
ncbi:Septin-9-like protein, partial [Dinothrombium tinctorium]